MPLQGGFGCPSAENKKNAKEELNIMSRKCYGNFPNTLGFPCVMCEDKQYCEMQSNGNVVHDLKCWPEFFEEIHIGNKNFEIRVNDRNYRVGDVLHLKEYNPQKNEYTGRELKRRVIYILDDVRFVIDGTIVMSLGFSL